MTSGEGERSIIVACDKKKHTNSKDHFIYKGLDSGLASVVNSLPARPAVSALWPETTPPSDKGWVVCGHCA